MLDDARCPKCYAKLILTAVDATNSTVGMRHLEFSRCDYNQQI